MQSRITLEQRLEFPHAMLDRDVTNFTVRVAIMIQQRGLWIKHTDEMLSCACNLVVYKEKTYTTQILHVSKIGL